jgi:hypothetical protein
MKAGDDSVSFTAAALYLLSGPLVWAAHLVLVYVPQSGLCAFRVTGAAAVAPLAISLAVGAVTALAAAILAIANRRHNAIARVLRAPDLLEGANGRFLCRVMRLLAALSLAGVLFAGATALLLPPCEQLR